MKFTKFATGGTSKVHVRVPGFVLATTPCGTVKAPKSLCGSKGSATYIPVSDDEPVTCLKCNG